LTRGRAAVPDPFDLSAVRRSDEVFDALSSRRPADVAPDMDDPAVRLLAGLAADVDAGAPPLPVPGRVACAAPARHRRGVGAIVSFGVAAIVLTSAGAAAAGGGGNGDAGAAGREVRPPVSERSNAGHPRHDPASAPATGDSGSSGPPAAGTGGGRKNDGHAPVTRGPWNPGTAGGTPVLGAAGPSIGTHDSTGSTGQRPGESGRGGSRSGTDGTEGSGEEGDDGPMWGPSAADPPAQEPSGRPEAEPGHGRPGRWAPGRPPRSGRPGSSGPVNIHGGAAGHGDHRTGGVRPDGARAPARTGERAGDPAGAGGPGDGAQRSVPGDVTAQPE
jgi:hypothetical protein